MTKDYKCDLCGKKRGTLKVTVKLKFIRCPKHFREMMNKTLDEILHDVKEGS